MKVTLLLKFIAFVHLASLAHSLASESKTTVPATTTEMSSAPPASSLTIKYWPLRARASGLFRMLAEANVEYEHMTDQKSMGCSLWGAETTNLAPPILVDHEAKLTLSQTIPLHAYIGNKYGFNKGINVPELALQYAFDLEDLLSEIRDSASKDQTTDSGVSELKAYLTGDRYKNHLRCIDRCIKGPYYFGEDYTYVDFLACCYLDMAVGGWLGPLKEKTGDTLEMHAPKLKAVYEKICALPSASKLDHLPLVPPSVVLSPERVAMWDDTDSSSK